MKNDKLDWLTFDFWWLFSLALMWLHLASLELLIWPENTLLDLSYSSPGDSNQAMKGASPWTGSNYPPFRTTGYTTGEAQEPSNLYGTLEVHAVHFHIGT